MGKSNKVALVCQVCGATFYKVPSAITMETRCCSKECRGKVQAEIMGTFAHDLDNFVAYYE